MQNADVGAMWDMIMYNAGFFVIKSTKYGLKTWELTCKLTSIGRKINDQDAFNSAIRKLLAGYDEISNTSKPSYRTFILIA